MRVQAQLCFLRGLRRKWIKALKRVCDYITSLTENVACILDAKRADIGNTNLGSVAAAFKYLGADAITVNPYFGKVALQPFLEQKDKGIFVLARTSNDGAGEFQDLELKDGGKLYEKVIYNIENEWDAPNCCLVIGATVPEELAAGRKVAPKRIILVPGVGAQGGDLEKSVQNGLTQEGDGIIINSSRGIIYASKGTDFAEAAHTETVKLNTSILAIRETVMAA
jgi:orotidine-5'-phosphate decarboxylase